MLEAWRTAERARNMQIEYGQLAESHSRLPLGLQGAAMDRMRSLGAHLRMIQTQYPRNFPRGHGPSSKSEQRLHRSVA